MTDKSIDYYIERLKEYFYTSDDVGKTDVDIWAEDKPMLIAQLEEMETFRSNWDKLLNDIKNIPQNRVRDISGSGERHSFKALFVYNDGNSGIVLALSFPFKIYGFYFARFIPYGIEGRHTQEIAYSSFDTQGIELCSEIEKMINDNFNGFDAFNKDYAAVQAVNFIIDGMQHEKIDLWKAFFTTNMFGII